jgi:hypothetical protein
VIAGNEYEFAALAHFAQKLLQNIVMGLRQLNAAPDAPEVDNVAHQVDLGRLVVAQEIEKSFGLARLGSEMDVGNK